MSYVNRFNQVWRIIYIIVDKFISRTCSIVGSTRSAFPDSISLAQACIDVVFVSLIILLNFAVLLTS
jgi:hypothetical protein